MKCLYIHWTIKGESRIQWNIETEEWNRGSQKRLDTFVVHDVNDAYSFFRLIILQMRKNYINIVSMPHQ